MKYWRRRSDWTGSRPLRWGVAGLSGLSLVLLAGVVYLFSLLDQSRQAMEDSVREDAMWAVYQTDRQASRMIATIDDALLAGLPDGAAPVVAAYDILYSRAELLEEGSFGVKFSATPSLYAEAQRVSDDILGLAARVDALAAAPSGPGLRALRSETEAVQRATGNLVVLTNAALNQTRVAQRAEAQGLQAALGISVGLLVVGFAGIVTLMALQMRLIATVGRKLAILGERNRAIAKRARAASRAKSTFLATMSHEIRTPLNGIIGTAELMAHAHLSPEQERHLSTIRESGYHLLEVISDVLDFSKLESGKVEFEIHRVRLPDVAMLLRAMLAPRAELKGLRLGIDLPALEVGTDPARLRQILVNLLGNALKFTTEGSVTATGRLTAPGRLRIEIADTGIGIPDAAMSLLFRDFSQVDGSASRSFGGTGLGLVICKRIAEGLGGRIGATSRPGEGSTFWFEIPVADPLPVEAAAATPPDPAHAREGAFQGRVLVVEDNPVNRTVAKGLLGWLGVEVEMAHNGAQAVERLAQGGCDLVLMDVQMPVMNGLEATEEIRRRGDPVRIVGLTGNAFISDRADCLRAGMDDFVAKPVTQDKLAQVLAEAGLQRPAGPAAKQSPEARPAPGGRSAPGPGAAPEAPLLDAGLFASLLGTLGAGTVEALLEEVMAEAAALPAAFAEGEAGDSGRLDAILHGFKGAAATLGLAEAARLAQALRDGGGRGPEATERPLRAALAGADMARAALRAAGRPVAA